jgi:hypothetical protein
MNGQSSGGHSLADASLGRASLQNANGGSKATRIKVERRFSTCGSHGQVPGTFVEDWLHSCFS